MNSNLSDESDAFDRTPEGEAMVALLRRHAPPPPDVEHARTAVLDRLPAGRSFTLAWAGPALGAAAAVLITVLLLTQEASQPAHTTTPAPVADATPAAEVVRGGAAPQLVAVVRGPSGDGWRVDAGLKDGLRTGDTLSANGREYTVSAIGIFESRVKGTVAPARGDRLTRAIDTPALQRADAMAAIGGDPGGFYDFGAVFETLPVSDARNLGFADGNALRVAEVIRTVLRDFSASPETTLAAKLGLQVGDVIVSVNGYEAGDLSRLANALQWTRTSSMLQVTMLRDGRTVELALK
ncbi:MAG: PDZ domain-containing protein [Planctomycetes bacterium]|nr:PDZ domain-containing protein [Planctomycetota bacterium]